MTVLTRRHAPIGVQRRMAELGRIRFGEKVKGAGKKPYPRALDKFRLTSASRELLEAAREVYGGKAVREWEDAPDKGMFELYTDASEIDVVLPPVFAADDGMPAYPYSQAYELWDGPTCARRCDGEVATVPKGRGLQTVECLCDPTNRACQVVTRITVMLPRLPGVGLWRLDSRGWTAATYLPGTLEMLSLAASQRRFVPARLRLEHRSAKRRNDKGEIETRRFIVPVLDPGITAGQLVAAIGSETFNVPALPSGERPQLTTVEAPVDARLTREQPDLGPLADLPVAEPPAFDQPGEGERDGAPPRAVDVMPLTPPPVPEQSMPAGTGGSVGEDEPTPAPATNRFAGLHAAANERGIDHDGIKLVAQGIFGWDAPDARSLNDLTPLELGKLRKAIDDLPIASDAPVRSGQASDGALSVPSGAPSPVTDRSPAPSPGTLDDVLDAVERTAVAHGIMAAGSEDWAPIYNIGRSLFEGSDPDEFGVGEWVAVGAEIATGAHDPKIGRPGSV